MFGLMIGLAYVTALACAHHCPEALRIPMSSSYKQKVFLGLIATVPFAMLDPLITTAILSLLIIGCYLVTLVVADNIKKTYRPMGSEYCHCMLSGCSGHGVTYHKCYGYY